MIINEIQLTLSYMFSFLTYIFLFLFSFIYFSGYLYLSFFVSIFCVFILNLYTHLFLLSFLCFLKCIKHTFSFGSFVQFCDKSFLIFSSKTLQTFLLYFKQTLQAQSNLIKNQVYVLLNRQEEHSCSPTQRIRLAALAGDKIYQFTVFHSQYNNQLIYKT